MTAQVVPLFSHRGGERIRQCSVLEESDARQMAGSRRLRLIEIKLSNPFGPAMIEPISDPSIAADWLIILPYANHVHQGDIRPTVCSPAVPTGFYAEVGGRPAQVVQAEAKRFSLFLYLSCPERDGMSMEESIEILFYWITRSGPRDLELEIQRTERH